MQSDRETRIKERAHAIWERAGRPHGQHDEHWRQAEAEIAEEERSAAPAGHDRGIVEAVVETAASVAEAALHAATAVVTGGKRASREGAGKPRAGKAAKAGAATEQDEPSEAAAPKSGGRTRKAPQTAEKTTGTGEKPRVRPKAAAAGTQQRTDTGDKQKAKSRGRGKAGTQPPA